MVYTVKKNLYKATTKFCGLSRQVVFHDREIEHDFLKTMQHNWWNLCDFSKTSLVSLYTFHCTTKNDLDIEMKSDVCWR